MATTCSCCCAAGYAVRKWDSLDHDMCNDLLKTLHPDKVRHTNCEGERLAWFETHHMSIYQRVLSVRKEECGAKLEKKNKEDEIQTYPNLLKRTVRWSDEAVDSFYKKWDDQVRWNDPNGFCAAGNAYAYMEKRLREKVFGNKPGCCGYEWACALQSKQEIFRAIVFTDGASEASQCSEFTTPSPGENWWPCIVILKDGLLLFYCPALAWQWAKPWYCHPSRVFFLSRL